MQTAVDWLLGIQPPSKSMVGTFSSNEFQVLAANHVDRFLVENTCLLLYATTQAHIQRLEAAENGVLEAGPCTLSETAYLSGQKVIDSLDKMLSPLSLAGMSKEALQVTFLVIVAITLSVGYTTQLSESPLPDEALTPRLTTPMPLWEAMRHHICEMLSHHMILIASKLQFKFQHEFQKTLITSALNKWDKQGRFTWVEFESASPEPASPDPALSFPFDGASPDPAVPLPSEDVFTDFSDMWMCQFQTSDSCLDGPVSGFDDATSNFVFDSLSGTASYGNEMAGFNETFPQATLVSSQFSPFMGAPSPGDDKTGNPSSLPDIQTSYYHTVANFRCQAYDDRESTPLAVNSPSDETSLNGRHSNSSLTAPQRPKRRRTAFSPEVRARVAAARKIGTCSRCQSQRMRCVLGNDCSICSTCKTSGLKIDPWCRIELAGFPRFPDPPLRGGRTATTPGHRAGLVSQRKTSACAECRRRRVQCSHADLRPVAAGQRPFKLGSSGSSDDGK